MKKICIALLLCVTGIYAAESSSAGEQSIKWDALAVHDNNGVQIEFGVKSVMDNGLPAQCVTVISHSLALRLSKDMSFKKASNQVQDVLEICEKKVKDVKIDAFFENLKRACSQKDFDCEGPLVSIQQMSLTLALAQSGVKLKVEGKAEPYAVQTFFPPYTIVSEGSNELSPAEKEQARLADEFAKAQQKLDALNAQSMSALLGALDCDSD